MIEYIIDQVLTMLLKHQKTKSLVSAACAFLVLISGNTIAAGPSDNLTKRMQALGTIVETKPFSGGLNSWILKAPNGKHSVFYTTADEKVLINGTAWDSVSKKNISDPLKNKAKALNATANTQASTTAKNQNVSNGYSHPVFTAVKHLKGIKEGRGNDNDTVYIIFDPRCTYCHQAFNNSRSYVAKGATIKWIPALALGESASALQISAGLLRSNSIKSLEKSFNGTDSEINSVKAIPTSSESASINQSLEYLKSAFFFHEDVIAMPADERAQRDAIRKNNPDALTPLNPGVPAAIFVNKRTGKVEVRKGVSETETLNYIFNMSN